MDTRSKRASSVGFFRPYVMALPLPDGAIGAGDRKHIVWNYSGELAGYTLTNPDPDNFVFMRYRERRHFVTERNKRAVITYRERRHFVTARNKRAVITYRDKRITVAR